MNGINRVMLLGYLGADPELQTSRRGKPYAKLRLATHHRAVNEDGELQTATEWHRIMVWGKDAENCKTYLQKGAPVVVEGSISSFKGERDDGSEFYHTSILAHRVHFVGPRASQAPSGFAEPTP